MTLTREERIGLQVDSILSALRSGAVIHSRWWRPSWQAGYEAGLRRAHEAVTEEFGHLGMWTPSQPRPTSCGDKETTADGDVLRCDLPTAHDGDHSCVVLPETRFGWLRDSSRTDRRTRKSL